jgi:ribosomal protein S27AE
MESGVRSCPRCGGTLLTSKYLGEWYQDCVQCGYVVFLDRYWQGRPRTRTSPDAEDQKDAKREALPEESEGKPVRRRRPSGQSRPE